jgi:hypothetical protein
MSTPCAVSSDSPRCAECCANRWEGVLTVSHVAARHPAFHSVLATHLGTVSVTRSAATGSCDVELDIADAGNDVEVSTEASHIGTQGFQAGGGAVLDLADAGLRQSSGLC